MPPRKEGLFCPTQVLNTKRVSLGSRAFPQGLGQWLWVIPKAHSPTLSAPNVFPATSQPPEQPALVPPSTHHLCPPESTCSHQLPSSQSTKTLLAAQVTGSLPEEPNVHLFLGGGGHNVHILLMQGATRAESNTPANWPKTVWFHMRTHVHITPGSKHRDTQHTEIQSPLYTISARWQSLGNYRVCLHVCALVSMQ